MSHTGSALSFPFPVHFTRSAWHPANRIVVDAVRRLAPPDQRQRLLVVVDDGLAGAQASLLPRVQEYVRAHADSLDLACRPVLVPGGETAKSDLVHAFDLLRRINDLGLQRQAVIVAIGGGAALDMISFVAAMARGGIPIIRMPTTLLAQASAAAVESGMNLFGRKDFVSTSASPAAVISDTDALATLSCRDSIAGLSEIVRIAITRSDAFYRHLESDVCDIVTHDPEVRAAMVQRAVELQLESRGGRLQPGLRATPPESGEASRQPELTETQIESRDFRPQPDLTSSRPRESWAADGPPLAFGEWAAHAVESLAEGRLRHGEALAIGMALDLEYCVDRGYLARSTADSVLRLLEAFGFRLWDDGMDWRSAGAGRGLIEGLQEVRERLRGDFEVTLLRDIGITLQVHDVDESAIARAIAALGARGRTRRSASACRITPS